MEGNSDSRRPSSSFQAHERDGSNPSSGDGLAHSAIGPENTASTESSRKDNSGGDKSADLGNLDDEAAVGSIHHILRTAFKELYPANGDAADKNASGDGTDATAKEGRLSSFTVAANALEKTEGGPHEQRMQRSDLAQATTAVRPCIQRINSYGSTANSKYGSVCNEVPACINIDLTPHS